MFFWLERSWFSLCVVIAQLLAPYITDVITKELKSFALCTAGSFLLQNSSLYS